MDTQIDQEFKKPYYESRNKALRKILMEFNYEDLMTDEGIKWKHYVPQKKLEAFNVYITNRRQSYRQRWSYIMFTINFKDGADLKAIKRKTKKAVEKKWIREFIYRFECRGYNEEPNEYTGIHVHMWVWIKDNKYVYSCKREMYNTYKDLIGTKYHINSRYSNDPKAFKQYVLGFKKGEPKKNYELDEKLNKMFETI